MKKENNGEQKAKKRNNQGKKKMGAGQWFFLLYAETQKNIRKRSRCYKILYLRERTFLYCNFEICQINDSRSTG